MKCYCHKNQCSWQAAAKKKSARAICLEEIKEKLKTSRGRQNPEQAANNA